jgi:hypothetical protein
MSNRLSVLGEKYVWEEHSTAFSCAYNYNTVRDSMGTIGATSLAHPSVLDNCTYGNKKSRWSDSNRRQVTYEATTLPLSYTGWLQTSAIILCHLRKHCSTAELHRLIDCLKHVMNALAGHLTLAIIPFAYCSCQAFFRVSPLVTIASSKCDIYKYRISLATK